TSWTDPVLEEILAATAAIGFVVAYLREGFAATPPRAPAPEPSPGAESPTPLLQQVAALKTDERRIRHRLRKRDLAASERASLEAQMSEVGERLDALRRTREEEYAG
ncbi:MAG: hypothetical protein ACREC5_08785, partial [Thermoplasmata archaeon]